MAFFQNTSDKEAPPAVTAVRRWLHAVTGHFTFLVCMGGVHCVSLAPGIVFAYLFRNTGGLLFLAAGILLSGLAGVVWTAIHRMAWRLQFGFPVYLFKEFRQDLKKNFRQGWILGVIFAALWALLASPLYIAEVTQQGLPFAVVCIMGAAALLLIVFSSYAHYQISRYELTLGEALRNSLLLLFSMGWRSVIVCLLWIALAAGMLFAGQILLPVCLLCGFTVILCITEQTFLAPRIDKLMTPAKSNKKEQ